MDRWIMKAPYEKMKALGFDALWLFKWNQGLECPSTRNNRDYSKVMLDSFWFEAVYSVIQPWWCTIEEMVSKMANGSRSRMTSRAERMKPGSRMIIPPTPSKR